MSGSICISYIEAVITNGPKGWRDACQDRGLGATWLSQSSYNLHCSLIRFERQSGSINQSAHPVTAGSFCPTVTSGPSRLWWDEITQQKQKQYHPSPRTTRASWILCPLPGTAVNPQHMPSTQNQTASQTDHGSLVTSSPLPQLSSSLFMNHFNSSTPNVLLVYSLHFDRLCVLVTK